MIETTHRRHRSTRLRSTAAAPYLGLTNAAASSAAPLVRTFRVGSYRTFRDATTGFRPPRKRGTRIIDTVFNPVSNRVLGKECRG